MSKRSKPKNPYFLMVLLAALGGSLALMTVLIWHSVTEQPVATKGQPFVVVYKNPSCGCCSKWVKHLQVNGFMVEVHDVPDVSVIRDKVGIPAALGSCHTAMVNGYVIEGHVPAADIRKLLTERPTARGLVVTGMPVGSPGMEEGSTKESYPVLLLNTDGSQRVYSQY